MMNLVVELLSFPLLISILLGALAMGYLQTVLPLYGAIPIAIGVFFLSKKIVDRLGDLLRRKIEEKIQG